MEYEYGWNDPPSSCYSAAASSSQKTASGKLTHLTRRPCHPPPHATPPTTPSSTATPPPVLTAPPTTTTYNGGADATKKTTSQSTTDERSTDLGIYDNADFTEVIQRLNDLTDSLREKFQVRVYNDIKRRLDLLSAQFTNDKLSPAVKLKMGQMVAALDKKDYNKADALHIGLMVDHVSEVSQWLVGVKKLISTLKSES